MEEAYKQNKGVIIATGHFGNWELLGATIALHGYPMLSITRKQNNKYMDRFINEYREMVGQKVAYNRGEHGLLAISRILKEKKLLGVLYDQDTNDDGVDLKLLYREFMDLLFYHVLFIIVKRAVVRLKYIRRFIRLRARIGKRIFMM